MPPNTVATNQNLKKKKKKKQCGSPKLDNRWTAENVIWTVAKHCSGIAAFYIVNRYVRKKSTNWWLKKKKYILNKPKVL